MTDAEEHERDKPYNGPRDPSQPSIRVEEAPPPAHLEVTAFPRSAAPLKTLARTRRYTTWRT